jgi:hypothetical protein
MNQEKRDRGMTDEEAREFSKELKEVTAEVYRIGKELDELAERRRWSHLKEHPHTPEFPSNEELGRIAIEAVSAWNIVKNMSNVARNNAEYCIGVAIKMSLEKGRNK